MKKNFNKIALILIVLCAGIYFNFSNFHHAPKINHSDYSSTGLEYDLTENLLIEYEGQIIRGDYKNLDVVYKYYALGPGEEWRNTRSHDRIISLLKLAGRNGHDDLNYDLIYISRGLDLSCQEIEYFSRSLTRAQKFELGNYKLKIRECQSAS